VACLTSDGEWQEGSTWEALIFAAHHKLSNLKILVDVNGFQAFGTTAAVSSMEDLGKRFAGFDVAVTEVNGHDETEILAALEAETTSPHIILMRTVKGHGVSFLENRLESHYLPLTADQFQQASTEISRLS
jgi:transketolase